MAFWKPDTIAPGSSIDRAVERESADEGTLLVLGRESNTSLYEQRQQLPIAKHRRELLYLIETHQVTIVVGRTGSGKTTQLPQYLHEAGWSAGGRTVACCQPRRIAATSVAARVADEVGCTLGREVGYTVRFDDCSDPKITRIKYLTDGMLFRETLVDPLLSRYSVIMVDEAHERSLYTDIIIGVLKKILKKRPELRIIISSATIDAKAFYEFYNTNSTGQPSQENVAITSLEGRMYPVDVLYLAEATSDYILESVHTVMKIHQKHYPRMRNTIEMLPLHGSLPYEEQKRVFEPAPKSTRKVIFSTNVAEASVTIDGIVYVVDAGFVKLRSYNPSTGMESLCRAGRSGRTRPGKAFRIYTEEGFSKLSANNTPEIQRSNLMTVVLQLKALGIENVLRFDFLSAPPAEMMIRSLELLYSLKALDDYGRLTIPFGTSLAEFPLDPFLASTILNSHRFKCGAEILTIAAMLSVQNVFVVPSGQRREAEEERRKFAVEEGDHLTYLNVYNAFIRSNRSAKWCYQHFLNHKSLQRAVSIRNQLSKYASRFGIPIQSALRSHNRDNSDGDDDDDMDGDDDGSASCQVRKCLVSGYFAQAARLQIDGTYKTVRDNVTLHIHPNSVLFQRSPPWIIFHEVVETTKVFMRDITVVEPEWLVELAPHYYKHESRRN
ncbi:P-loop containing nucleoside triphosphate hydrolase protein [Polychytrium aggregatum]|uniref:P-loop containing nucleoside triphosphate hydrolase protein n=1 Tax=Polychytrium aggregatum TaxID=110093 RepID=UPI0022FEA1E4|nr:P-loop containing nucleoside triphosphate hydrolase protein [Polychytrium aggregatum]KAI9202218.1 P-loop containing nucleoside triphosphate hydrolase protein [Polychytrium aggregatum]